MKHALLLSALLLGGTAMATPLHLGVAFDDVYDLLRKAPLEALHLDGARYQLVNDRYEPCRTRQEARRHGRFIQRITPGAYGWTVEVMDANGTVRMAGQSLDRDGSVYDGTFQYFDDAGRLRAEGAYDRDRKTGTWQRYDTGGARLPDKEYHAEDWEQLQVRLGLASMSAVVGQEAAAR